MNAQRPSTTSPASAARAMTAREWGMLLGLSVLWGGSFLFIELGLRDFGPMSLVFMRLALAALALHAALRLLRVKLPGGRMWGWYFLLGMLNNAVPFALMFWGLTRIGGALASMLNATTPLFTVVLAHFMTRDERMTLNRLAGCLLGVAGVGVMVGREALSGEGELLAYLAVLGAGVCYAFAGIFGRRVGQVPPLALATGQLTAAAILIAPLAALEQPWNATPGWQSLAALIALALVSTSFAYVLYFKLLKAAGATNILLVTLLVPVSSTLLCVPLLGEVLEWRQVAGMGVIALGLLLVDGRILRRR